MNMKKLSNNKIYQYLLYLIILLLFLGGIMGIIKRTVPGYEHFSFNAFIGMQGQDPDMVIVVIYSMMLAILEIISAIALLWGFITKKSIGLYMGIVTISISALGSLVAILLGDIFAVFSLGVRIVALVVLLSGGMRALYTNE